MPLLQVAAPGTAAAGMAPTADFRGVWPIMATPYLGDESVDLESFARSIEFMRRAGCQGCTITGVLGESNRLLDSEREAMVKAAVAAAGDMPICVGTSHPGTTATRELSKMAERLGAAAVMVTPSKEKTPLSDDRMVEYFSKIAEGISIKMVLQDHPGSTEVSMSVPLLARIANEVPNIVSVKMESLPSPPKIAQLRALIPPETTILTGLGALYGGFDLQAGMDGFMTGFAFPEALSAMVNARNSGEPEKCWQLYKHWLPLLVFEQQPGVGVRKEIYRMRGLLTSGIPRHPAAPLSASAAQMLRETLARTLPAGADLSQPLSAADVQPPAPAAKL